MLRLLELDERHSELLGRLEELDRQVAVVLDEWARTKELSPIADEKEERLVVA